MKKLLLTFVVLIGVSAVLNAQQFKIGAGPALSVPVGNLSKSNSIGIGAEVTGVYEFSESIQGFGQIGYQRFLPKSMNVYGTSIKTDGISHLPFIIGARYNANGILVGAGLGYSIFEKSSGFTFSPQVGYSLEKFDVIGHFTSASIAGASISYFGVKAHYFFY